MTAQPLPIRNVDSLVERYIDLADRIADLTAQQIAIKTQLRDLGPGDHPTNHGVTVKIGQPARSFNAKTAVELLAPEVLELCKADGYDAKKLKSFLPPVLLERCMDPGKGDLIVRVG